MHRKYAMTILVCLVTLGFAVSAFAGYPDPAMSTATTAATNIVSVFSIPDGNGDMISAAKEMMSSTPVDATITLTVLDIYGNPVFMYPKEDMWLETDSGGILPCTDGTIADADTDINGMTTFSQTVYIGGGSAYVPSVSIERTIVVIDGMPLTQPGLDILFNTGDLSRDRLVGVSDSALFKPLYTGGVYAYDIDYYFDGAITLSDLVLFAGAMNTQCP